MSPSKSKCWHSNNCLHFLKRVVPLKGLEENLKVVWAEFATLSMVVLQNVTANVHERFLGEWSICPWQASLA
jgi:hypothetical protein